MFHVMFHVIHKQNVQNLKKKMIQIQGSRLETCVPVFGFGLVNPLDNSVGLAFSEKLDLVATTWHRIRTLKTYKITHEGICPQNSFPLAFDPDKLAFFDCSDTQPPCLLAVEHVQDHASPCVHVMDALTGEHIGYMVQDPPSENPFIVRSVATKGAMVALAGWRESHYFRNGGQTSAVRLYVYEAGMVWNLVRVVAGTSSPNHFKCPIHVSWSSTSTSTSASASASASASDTFTIVDYWGKRFPRFASGDGTYLGCLPYGKDYGADADDQLEVDLQGAFVLRDLGDGDEGFFSIAECQDGWLAVCAQGNSILYIGTDGTTKRLSVGELQNPTDLVPVTLPPDFVRRHSPVQGFLVMNYGNGHGGGLGGSLQVFAPGDDMAMAGMSGIRVAWMQGVFRAGM